MSLRACKSKRARTALVVGVLFGALSAAGCGERQPQGLAKRAEPILGGSVDSLSTGVVALALPDGDALLPFCSGTLLAPNLVLTARHCVSLIDAADETTVDCSGTKFGQHYDPASIRVSVETNVGQDGLAPYGVSNIWVAPGEDLVCGQDLALLVLAGAGIPSTAAQPIEPNLNREVEASERFSAVGYGLQDPQDLTAATSGHRMRVDDAQVYCTGDACKTDLIASTEWIADSPVCSGDSGGPALDATNRVAGVTSRGDPRCSVAIYASVYVWRKFIGDSAFRAAAQGAYPPPAWAGDPPPGFEPSQPRGGSGGTGMQPGGGGGPVPTPLGAGGSGGSGPSAATIDPLGIACTSGCPGAYACWAESGSPPGICVPHCGEGMPACPETHTCAESVQACIPRRSGNAAASGQDAGGCTLVAPASPHAGTPTSRWVAGLALLVLLVARRRVPRVTRAAAGT